MPEGELELIVLIVVFGFGAVVSAVPMMVGWFLAVLLAVTFLPEIGVIRFLVACEGAEW